MTWVGSSAPHPFYCTNPNNEEHFPLDRLHLLIKVLKMGNNFIRLFSMLALLAAPLAVSGQAKTLTQLELEDIQKRQKRLFEAHRKETNDQDQESIEFRIFALRDEYESLLSKNSENVPVLVTYGLFLAQIGQRDDSLKLLLKADALEPEHPQVKNQLGNFMTEEASYALALPYYLDAIRLSPKEPLYYYQLGNLLHYFREEFVQDGVLTGEHLDKQMFDAFKRAAELGEENLAYVYRYAECFYDIPDADMEAALKEWERIETLTEDETDKQLVRLHQANVHLLLGNKSVVPIILEKVTDPNLKDNKEKLLEEAARDDD